MAISGDRYPRLLVGYAGHNAGRPDDTIDVDEFIGVKSHRAKGKRVTTLEVGRIVFTDPIEREPRPEEPSGENDPGNGASGEGAGTDTASAGASEKESPAAKKPEPKNYVAGDTVEFDVAGEEEKGNGRQMELF